VKSGSTGEKGDGMIYVSEVIKGFKGGKSEENIEQNEML
jgi:nitrogen regulatory protein PII